MSAPESFTYEFPDQTNSIAEGVVAELSRIADPQSRIRQAEMVILRIRDVIEVYEEELTESTD